MILQKNLWIIKKVFFLNFFEFIFRAFKNYDFLIEKFSFEILKQSIMTPLFTIFLKFLRVYLL